MHKRDPNFLECENKMDIDVEPTKRVTMEYIIMLVKITLDSFTN
jgi:hypothetical protein